MALIVLWEVRMLRSGYLRQQAETCLRLSQKCSSDATAEELRLMAAEFFSRAIEAENDWLTASQVQAPPQKAKMNEPEPK